MEWNKRRIFLMQLLSWHIKYNVLENYNLQFVFCTAIYSYETYGQLLCRFSSQRGLQYWWREELICLDIPPAALQPLLQADEHGSFIPEALRCSLFFCTITFPFSTQKKKHYRNVNQFGFHRLWYFFVEFSFFYMQLCAFVFLL